MPVAMVTCDGCPRICVARRAASIRVSAMDDLPFEWRQLDATMLVHFMTSRHATGTRTRVAAEAPTGQLSVPWLRQAALPDGGLVSPPPTARGRIARPVHATVYAFRAAVGRATRPGWCRVNPGSTTLLSGLAAQPTMLLVGASSSLQLIGPWSLPSLIADVRTEGSLLVEAVSHTQLAAVTLRADTACTVKIEGYAAALRAVLGRAVTLHVPHTPARCVIATKMTDWTGRQSTTCIMADGKLVLSSAAERGLKRPRDNQTDTDDELVGRPARRLRTVELHA